MTYEEFEWNILKLAYEDGLERFQPSFIAYALGLPHETVSSYLEHATHAGLLEMEVTDEGRIEYFVPGLEEGSTLPRPQWKDELEGPERADHEAAGIDQDAGTDAQPGPPDEQVEQAGPASADGTVDIPPERRGRADERPADQPQSTQLEPADQPSAPAEPTDGALEGARARRRALVRAARRTDLPPALRAHIEERYGGEDGTVTDVGRPGSAVVAQNARPDTGENIIVDNQLVKADQQPQQQQTDNLPMRIETGMETFTDPSQTIFMRQLKVYGVTSEKALREHVERLFTSFGYQAVQTGQERLRFERGSVTFILALVPLFVLVLPLFVYLFLYCMGRSTIHQEPIELDVQFRKLGDAKDTYEIDLTFIGMHGVVLGAADQKVLNQEVDTLRDELQWALTTG